MPVMMAERLGEQTGGVAKARVEARALRGEPVEVRRDGVGIAVAAQVGADILGADPQDVGPAERRGRGRRLGARVPLRRSAAGEKECEGSDEKQGSWVRIASRAEDTAMRRRG